MLGYGEVAGRYLLELPQRLRELQMETAVVGKNHFGWNPGFWLWCFFLVFFCVLSFFWCCFLLNNVFVVFA